MDPRLRSAATYTLALALGLCAFTLCVIPGEAQAARWRWTPSVQRPVYVAPAMKPANLNRPREERIIDLPEDGDMWHLTTVTDATDQRSHILANYLVTAPRLIHLRNQVKFHSYAPSHWWVKQHFSADVKPMIILQNERGDYIYKASGSNLPGSAEELADELESAIWAHTSSCGPDCFTPSATRPSSRVPDTRVPGTSWLSKIPFEAIALLVVFAGAAFLLYRQRA